MKTLAAILLAVATLAPGETSASTVQQEIASRRFLVGNWHCTYTVGAKAGYYNTRWALALDDKWLTQSIDQPPQGDAGFRSSYFVGFDERRQGWIRFGAMTTGQYFAIRMRDLGNGGWGWKYVSFFPPRRRMATPATSDDARFTRVSNSKYKIDGPTYPGPSGARVTEHHICNKVV